MKIKICGLTDSMAVAVAVAEGADALGFVFADSTRRVTPERARSLCEGVPPGIARVAVMLHPTQSDVDTVLEVFEPDALQSDAEDFKHLEIPDGPALIPVYREGICEPALFAARDRDETAAFQPDFLYEGARSGKGQAVDWARAAVLASRGRMLLAGGLDPENVAMAVRRVRPWGVDVSTGVEGAPGKKDPARIRAFIQAAREAAASMHEELSS